MFRWNLWYNQHKPGGDEEGVINYAAFFIKSGRQYFAFYSGGHQKSGSDACVEGDYDAWKRRRNLDCIDDSHVSASQDAESGIYDELVTYRNASGEQRVS